MAYATAAEVKAYSALSEIAALSDDDLNNKYIPRAERIINSYCRQNFNRSALKVISVDGSGGNRLELPERLISLSQLRFLDPGAHTAQANGLSNIDFITASHYSISDDTKIEVAGGKVELVGNPGITKTWPFTTPANYTYDSDKIEVTGGVARLKDRIPAGANFHANYETNENGNWGDGTLTGTLLGSASVAGGFLVCTATSDDGARYSADNFPTAQQGAIRIKFKPNFTGGPGGNQYIANLRYPPGEIYLRVNSSGSITLVVKNSSGASIVNDVTSNIPWVSGQEYEIELNYDFATPAYRLFIDGNEELEVLSGSFVRSTASDVSYVGRYSSGAGIDGSIGEITFFDQVQHTANYTPGETIPASQYATDNPTIEVNDGIAYERVLEVLEIVATIAGSDAIQAIISNDDGSTYKYWNGSAWVASNGTYAQSNPIATAEANLGSFDATGTFKIKFFLHSDDGSTRPSLDEAKVEHNELTGYSTDDDLYVETTDNSQISPSNFLSWASFIATYVLPTGTDIKIMLSVDERITWLTWNGSRWTTASNPALRANGTSLTDAAARFSELDARKPLDVRIFAYTSDAGETPEVSNISIGSLTISENAVVSSVNVDQVFNKNWYLMLDAEPVRARSRLGKQERLEDTLIFPLGFENIEITGYFGYASVPTAVREAVSEIVEKIVVNESSKVVKHGTFKKEKIGDYEYERFTSSDREARDSFLSSYVKDLLREYKKPILISRI